MAGGGEGKVLCVGSLPLSGNAVLLCVLAMAVAVCVSVSSLDGSALFCFVVSFRTGLKRGGENKLFTGRLTGALARAYSKRQSFSAR